MASARAACTLCIARLARAFVGVGKGWPRPENLRDATGGKDGSSCKGTARGPADESPAVNRDSQALRHALERMITGFHASSPVVAPHHGR